MPDLTKAFSLNLAEGSLNLILSSPIRLREGKSYVFDRGIRQVWPALLNGWPVLVYRWSGMPLHLLEVLAQVNLRQTFHLRDNDKIEIEIAPRYVEDIPAADYVAWASLWLGRSGWPYRRDRYFLATLQPAIKLGATQSTKLHGYKKMAKIKIRNILGFSKFTRNLVSGYDMSVQSKDGSRFTRIENEGSDDRVRDTISLKNLLNYTKTSDSSYSAQQYTAGYHTIQLDGEVLEGQRNPRARIDSLGIDFDGATILDLGCNQGGMLHALGSQIKWGVGLDYDTRMVNVANKIARVNRRNNLSFYAFNLENESLDIIKDFLPSKQLDYVFLLSVCMWIANWKEVILFFSKISDAMIFESNGTPEQQDEQIDYLREIYASVEQVTEESHDDPGQKSRRMYKARRLITEP